MTKNAEDEIPQLFISYSWTTPEHEEWVLKLATELTESGIHVVLDKWDLREGHDAHAFMEQMVSNPAIKKVAMICDRAYVAKADGRKGGVGTETQIITPQIFAANQQQQDKYVAIVREHDEEGNPCRPVYFGSRIFIDFTDDSDYARSFEQFTRWVYGKPIYTRPPLGKKPAFLSDDRSSVKLSIAPAQMRAIDALRGAKPHAVPSLREFFDTLAEQFSALEVDLKADPFDDAVMEVVTGFQPYRNSIIDVFVAVANYRNDPECWEIIRRFFEKIIPTLHYRGANGSYSDWDFDHVRIIAHELFLYLIATNIQYERFDAIKHFTRTPYYVHNAARNGADPMQTFCAMQETMKSLEARNERLHGGRRTSPTGDLVKDHAVGTAISFENIMTADFLLYFVSRTMPENVWFGWWPYTLVYLDRHSRGLEVFIRSRSLEYFNKLKLALGVNDKEELQRVIARMEANPNDLPRWGFTRLSAATVMNLPAIATTQ